MEQASHARMDGHEGEADQNDWQWANYADYYSSLFLTWNPFSFDGLGQDAGGLSFDCGGVEESLTKGLHIMAIYHDCVPAEIVSTL